jgi:hypothetical protein
MMTDNTEDIRKMLIAELQTRLSENEITCYWQLVDTFGVDNVWDSKALQEEFTVESFLAPFCFVVRKSDKQKGIVTFKHYPRFYFDFTPV